jgi:hypothetical protein
VQASLSFRSPNLLKAEGNDRSLLLKAPFDFSKILCSLDFLVLSLGTRSNVRCTFAVYQDKRTFEILASEKLTKEVVRYSKSHYSGPGRVTSPTILIPIISFTF